MNKNRVTAATAIITLTALLTLTGCAGTTGGGGHDMPGMGSSSPDLPADVNNADIMRPSLLAGLGLAMQPDFLAWQDVEDGLLEEVLRDWAPPPIALHLVTPPSAIRPARVEVLIAFLAKKMAAAPWLG